MKKSYSLIVFLILVLAAAAIAETTYRPMLVRAFPADKTQYESIRKGNFDIATARDGHIDIVAEDADLQRLLAAGIRADIIHEDLIAFYQSRNPLGATMGGFPTLDEAIAFMDSLHAQYPMLTSERTSIGQSIEGRDIWMMKISDNPWMDEDEPEFFINALIHAREPMGLESVLRYMNYLCSNYGTDPQVTNLVDNREFYFVPVINVDGYEYNRQTAPNGGGMWRKNRRVNSNNTRGVDLNRNWGYMWGYDNDGSSPNPYDETYRGESAFSEPETQVLREFINGRDFSIILNLHAYGDYMLYPWGYFHGHTDDQAIFSQIAEEGCSQNGYAPGTPWEILYSTNGDACDWQYGEQTEKPKIITFVIEIGNDWDGFWPQENRIDDLWNEVLPPMLYLSEVAANPFGQAPPEAPVLYPIGDVNSDSFTTAWSFTDSLNPAVAFELKELSGYQRIEDDYEGDVNAWWNLDGFSTRNNRHHAGATSLFSGSGSNYNASAVENNSVSIAEGDTLRIWVWYNIESNYDYAYVMASTDGGSTFENLAGNITTTYNPHGLNRGNGITGSSNNWTLAKFSLADYAGQEVILGMSYVTDGGVEYEGFYADQFYPVATFDNEQVIASDITDTTYVVTNRPEGEYYYTVRAKDAEDQWSNFSNREIAIVHPQTSVDNGNPVPSAFSLSQNYPNPFNPQTNIEFSLGVDSKVELTVYNILGTKVRTLVNSELEAGEHSVLFDGLNDNGQQVAAGVYFYNLKTADQSLTRRMVLLK